MIFNMPPHIEPDNCGNYVVMDKGENRITNQEANEVTFEIDNDKIIRYTPVPQYGKDIVKAEVIMDKETFIECYEKWIRIKGE